MPRKNAAAFLSYAHADDIDDQVTKLGRRLEAEIRVQLGYPVPLFQDRSGIRWGQEWRERINAGVNDATFLIAVLSPSFFASDECRREFELFLEREEALGRRDLILPLYYVTHRPVEATTAHDDDRVLTTVRTRQRFDWRDLRYESHTAPRAARAFAELGEHVREALERAVAPVADDAVSGATAQEGGEARRARRPPGSADPPTTIVDAMRRGDFTTIADAVAAASPGDRIVVRPGRYGEKIVIDRPLEIIGEGDPGAVVIETSEDLAVNFKATMGRLANLTIRKTGRGKFHAIWAHGGRLELEDCDVTADPIAPVGVSDAAEARIRRCRVHDGQVGILVYDDGRATIEDCEVWGTTYSGIEVREASAAIRKCHVHDCAQSGVYVNRGANAEVDDNTIVDNGFEGVDVKETGRALVRGNRIHRNRAGVRFEASTAGAVEANEILDNRGRPLAIDAGANVRLGTNTLPPGTDE